MAVKRSDRQVFQKPNGTWAYRYYNAEGTRVQKGGFARKGEAADELDEKLKEKRLGSLYKPNITLNTLCDDYLAQHQAAPQTITKITHLLKRARRDFGDRHVRSLTTQEISIWRNTIPEGSRWDCTQALKQVLNAGVLWKYLDVNPVNGISNSRKKPDEQLPYESWDEVFAVASELDPDFYTIPIFAVGTGLRPQEWLPLEWSDIDFEKGVVYIRRTYDGTIVKPYGKTERSLRTVPLRGVVLDALKKQPRRLDRKLVFPAKKGGYLNLRNFREREWKPAHDAAGVKERRIYDCRHTYATWSLRAGVNTFSLSRSMGTSLEMIDRTYGHLAVDAAEYEAGLLDRFDAMQDSTRHETGTTQQAQTGETA